MNAPDNALVMAQVRRHGSAVSKSLSGDHDSCVKRRRWRYDETVMRST